MADTTITSEMKRHAVIVSRKVIHSSLEIVEFLKVVRSCICKFERQLLNEKNGGELAVTRKRTEHCQHPDSPTHPLTHSITDSEHLSL
ncbi:unnamed protein product [Hymenolepis diminuta]|uniref:Uncharacterized protein n=1 Tax=Hymenolepis diminuta TaxID=6216 RepID=A0A564ZAR6_HYMDI|nr:unnamed protein product [Hymenolepis diminuta]